MWQQFAHIHNVGAVSDDCWIRWFAASEPLLRGTQKRPMNSLPRRHLQSHTQTGASSGRPFTFTIYNVCWHHQLTSQSTAIYSLCITSTTCSIAWHTYANLVCRSMWKRQKWCVLVKTDRWRFTARYYRTNEWKNYTRKEEDTDVTYVGKRWLYGTEVRSWRQMETES